MKYLLLNAIIPQDFSLATVEELKEALEEFGCSLLVSEGLRDPGCMTPTQDYYFITSNTKEAMEQMCNAVDMPGTMVEISAVYDQEVAIVTKKVIKWSNYTAV